MAIEWLGLEPDAAIQGAVERGLACFGGPPSRVVIAADLARVVSEFTGLPYETVRTGGEVGGRTLLDSEGEPVIFLGLALLEEGVSATERTVVHESGHASMLRRGEDIDDNDARSMPFAVGFILQMASIAMAEYRCERLVRSLDYEDTNNHDDRLIGHAIDPAEIAADPDCANPGTFGRWMAPVMQQYIVDLATAAAWGVLPGPDGMIPLFDNGSWEPLLSHLRASPDASVPLGTDRFAALVREACPLLADVLVDFGFEWVDGDDGAIYFLRRASDETLNQRLDAAAAWYRTQSHP